MRKWIRNVNPTNQTYTWSSTEREGEDDILSHRPVISKKLIIYMSTMSSTDYVQGDMVYR